MQKDADSSSNAPHLTHTPPSPPPDKQHQHQHQQTPSVAASDTYTEDEFVVIEWEEEDEAERITDLTTSAELSSLSDSADLSSSGEMAGEQYHDTHLDSMKRDWYQVWLHDKTVEKNDSWGFSSTGASRTASPARGGAKA
ncbi:hypothetical protein GTA08_BOTSDO08118 [Neofusicoccum parvum]|uniref:Uncharacterized protein n=1 Tax=Neofusicoccum parvum TaxID=310453 RepID=A0ACB5SMC3_9PEZI|nr:hypothetical protein GTA08_BOTSDO08118 [Neofusicoccum parvum]